jgi:RimJ/RimL family protein N-acetyltransferase
MVENKKFMISLPKNNGIEDIKTSKNILILGANGTGKTRLGAWIEFNSPQKDKVHRISAQKSLSMPNSTTSTSIDTAESTLLYGYANAVKERNVLNTKRVNRWSNNPATSFLHDYDQLMVYLFSENTEENTKYVAAARATKERIQPPITKLYKIKEIWEKILPYRELIIHGQYLETRIMNDETRTYRSSEMRYGWYAVRRGKQCEAPLLVGAGGYFGPHSEEGDVEIGFSVMPSCRRMGYAMEIAGALIENAFTYKDVKRVIAHTSPENTASRKVLEKCGFSYVSRDEETGNDLFEIFR